MQNHQEMPSVTLAELQPLVSKPDTSEKQECCVWIAQ